MLAEVAAEIEGMVKIIEEKAQKLESQLLLGVYEEIHLLTERLEDEGFVLVFNRNTPRTIEDLRSYMKVLGAFVEVVCDPEIWAMTQASDRAEPNCIATLNRVLLDKGWIITRARSDENAEKKVPGWLLGEVLLRFFMKLSGNNFFC